MINKLVSHFHLSVLEPQLNVLKVNVQSSLKDGSGSLNLLYGRLPLCVLNPVPQVMSLPPYLFLEIPPHPVLVVLKLVLILYPVFGRLVSVPIHSIRLRLPQQLLSCDLDFGWCIVLDLCYTHGAQVLHA